MNTKKLTTRLTAAGAVTIMGLLGLFSASASAAESGPQWTVTSVSEPTNFFSGDEAAYRVAVTNTGGASSDGSPITITDELPAGLSRAEAGASGVDQLAVADSSHSPGAKFTCVLSSCTYTGAVVPDDILILTFPVDVSASAASSVTNVVRVTGGGAPDAAMATPTTISEAPASFGISPGGATTALSSTQAGAHPDITTSIAFNTVNRQGSLPGDPKDLTDDLPPGFAGDLVDTPSCSPAKFNQSECPIGTQIGVTFVTVVDFTRIPVTITAAVYNLSPNPGEVAKFGFSLGAGDFDIQGNVTVRSGDYGLRVAFHNTDESIAELDNVSLTVWGVPADPSHDPWRLKHEAFTHVETHFGAPSEQSPAPYFTNPTSCEDPPEARFTVVSWQGQEAQSGMPFGSTVGCDRLGMEPSLTAEATTNRAYAPTGLNVVTKIPQTYENAAGLATSTLKKEVVTLPEGMTVNPSAGTGLAACSEAQYAEEAVQYVPGRGCPNESRLATVKILTPSLKEEVTGSLFLAEPAPFGEAGKNPFSSLLAVYLIARIPNRGVLIKSPGLVQPNELTGQLTTTFDNLPPLPFSVATFSFNQGANAPLVTPPTCGAFTVTAALTPYSDPEGAPLTPLVPPFPISASCPSGGAPPFAPGLTAGTENNEAGAYSHMNIRITRNDGEQEITRFSSILPPGLTANLSGVPFCPDADIEAAKHVSGAQEETTPSCPAASEIGQTVVGAGVGSVLAVTPGKVYMAGPYNGAPFSIVAITSAKVGPFDLGTVVVREALEINPETAVVTVDAKASDPIPHIIKGIVIHVRDIRVNIDRKDFTLNPTNCDPLTFSATVDGGGADPSNPADQVPVTVTNPFRVTACQALKFKPVFKVATSGKTSRSKGASLSVKLTYPKAPQGTQANIRSVKVNLPKQLPSRLTTLQKACPDSTFNANPAACPAASIVGHATAITPILPVPLTGPAYFVSHGGAKFPELIVVLQGYGVTLDLHGETFISKAGITSSTFRTVPDDPIGSFELTLPQGPYSALAANGNLCTSKLAMPTAFTAQNGMTIHQSTPIGVTGCKPTITVVRHSGNRKTATIAVSVPAAGKLVATGKGLSRATGKAGGAGTVTVKMTLSSNEQAFLAKHHGRRLKVAVKLLFTPKHGSKLSGSVTVLIG